MLRRLNRKAQTAIIDLFIALSIFILLVMIIVYLWNDYNTRINEDVEYEKMQLKAYQVTNQLVKTQGNPFSWEKNPNNFKEIGLVTFDRNISAEKLEAFVALARTDNKYNNIRSSFNLDGYGFNFNLTTLSNKNLKSSGGTPEGDEEIISVERYVIYGDEEAIFRFKIWKTY